MHGSQQVLKYLHRRGCCCLSSPVSFPCWAENSWSLVCMLEKTNALSCVKCYLKWDLYFRGPLNSEEITHPHFQPSRGTSCDPASFCPAEDRSHRNCDRNPSRELWSRDYQALAAMGVNSEQSRRKQLAQSLKQSLGKLRKTSQRHFSVSYGHWAGFSTIPPVMWALAREVTTKYYSHHLPPIHVLKAAQQKEELYFNILSLQDYTAAMCPGLSKHAARPSLVPLTFSYWWLTSDLPVRAETKPVQSGSSSAGTLFTFQCHI